MIKKICLISSGQPSVNPRLVKEADALSESGYDVEVIGVYWNKWAEESDKRLLKTKKWNYTCVGGNPKDKKLRYDYTRIRYKAARMLSFSFNKAPEAALSRATSDLIKAAKRTKADLYIAHNLGALPAAVKAAQKYCTKASFDAEDFHSAELATDKGNDLRLRLNDLIERKYLPLCSYITASSEHIAEAYVRKYNIKKPVAVLNVFPISLLRANSATVRTKDELSLYWLSQTIGPERGLEDVVLAMAKSSQNISLYLQGHARESYREDLLNLVSEKGLNKDKIIFLGVTFPEDLVNSASRYDVGLALERRRPLNRDLCITNKIFMYLLAGLSVIATDTQGQRSIVESIGEAGWLYEPGDIDTLAKKLDFLASNKNDLEESKKQALKMAQEKYNWDIEKIKFLKVVEEALKQKVLDRFNC